MAATRTASVIDGRKKYCQKRIRGVSGALRKASRAYFPDHLCAYVTGSYGRLEASRFSDIDVFFVLNDLDTKEPLPRVSEHHLYSDLAKIGKKFRFPEFSNDGEYLRVHRLGEMARWFYVVYVSEPVIAGCLNAIRLLAEGRVKHAAHITLMGPYDKQRDDAAELSRRIKGQPVRIYSNGTFFFEAQNTVFLKATCPAFPEVWDKPTIAEFIPHLTVYDGGERWYATEIARILYGAHIDLTFKATALEALKTPAANRADEIMATIPVDLMSSVIGRLFSPQLVRNSSHSVRIVCIQRLLEFMAGGCIDHGANVRRLTG